MNKQSTIRFFAVLLLVVAFFAVALNPVQAARTKALRISEGNATEVAGGPLDSIQTSLNASKAEIDTLFNYSSLYDLDSITSNTIPNATLVSSGLLLTNGSSRILVEDIILYTDPTGVAGPTNVVFATDNTNGLTGVAAPFVAIAVSGLGANKSVTASVSGTTKILPYLIEAGKKLYVAGNDGAGTGAGKLYIVVKYRRLNSVNAGLAD